MDAVDQYEREIKAFAEAFETGTHPRMDGSEAVGNIRVLDALAESADAGARVELE